MISIDEEPDPLLTLSSISFRSAFRLAVFPATFRAMDLVYFAIATFADFYRFFFPFFFFFRWKFRVKHPRCPSLIFEFQSLRSELYFLIV